MSKKISIIAFFLILGILIWFIFFLKIDYEYEAFIFKDKNTIYFIISNEIKDTNINIRIQNLIHEVSINFIEKQNIGNIYFIDNIDLSIKEQEIIQIKVLQNKSILNIFF